MRVDWAEQPTRSFETAVSLLVKNGKGVLAQVASAVSHAEADITHIDMGQEPASETTEPSSTNGKTFVSPVVAKIASEHGVDPTQVGTDTDWKQISTGAFQSCALRTSGALYCWGKNADGRLGDIGKCPPIDVGR